MLVASRRHDDLLSKYLISVEQRVARALLRRDIQVATTFSPVASRSET